MRRVVYLSLLLLFFTVPHILEDFATGEPAQAGIPWPLLALVVSTFIALQALGLHWLGREQRRGLWVHVVIGLFWPVASGFAQLPTILSGAPYRSGAISIFYVAGILVVGLALLSTTLHTLQSTSSK